MLVSDLMVNSRLKISYSMAFLWNNILMKILRNKRKKGHFLFIRGGAVLITTSMNLLDTKYEFYEFNDDLRDTIN